MKRAIIIGAIVLCMTGCATLGRMHDNALALPPETKATLGDAVNVVTGNPWYGALTMLLLGGVGVSFGSKTVRRVAKLRPKSDS